MTDGKYLSLHTEIVDKTGGGEALYVTTFASPVNIAKYTTIYGFRVSQTTLHGFEYEICYKSDNSLSGPVTTSSLIMKTSVTDLISGAVDSVIGTECATCPVGTTSLKSEGPPTYCAPPLLWDAWSDRPSAFNGTSQKDCYPMVSPSPLVILPVCSNTGTATSLVRYRSYACRETSDKNYRVSIAAKLAGTTSLIESCYAGDGQR